MESSRLRAESGRPSEEDEPLLAPSFAVGSTSPLATAAAAAAAISWLLCVSVCCFMLPFVEKPLSQTLHLKGLSLVCDRMWISSAELQANVLKQI